MSDTSGYNWGLFNDEGMLAGQMSHAQASAELKVSDPEDELVIARECETHEGERADTCELCATDGDDTDDDEENT